jgi:hypothetical protein
VPQESPKLRGFNPAAGWAPPCAPAARGPLVTVRLSLLSSWRRRRDSNFRRPAGVREARADREPAAEIPSAVEGPQIRKLAEEEGFEPPRPFRA